MWLKMVSNIAEKHQNKQQPNWEFDHDASSDFICLGDVSVDYDYCVLAFVVRALFTCV